MTSALNFLWLTFLKSSRTNSSASSLQSFCYWINVACLSAFRYEGSCLRPLSSRGSVDFCKTESFFCFCMRIEFLRKALEDPAASKADPRASAWSSSSRRVLLAAMASRNSTMDAFKDAISNFSKSVSESSGSGSSGGGGGGGRFSRISCKNRKACHHTYLYLKSSSSQLS